MKIFFLIISIKLLLLTFVSNNIYSQSQFQFAIGGTGSDIAYSIKQTTDGGYITVGSTNSFGAGGNDIFVVKFNGNGVIQWNRVIGGTGSDIAYSVLELSDGNFFVVGSTNSFGAGNSDIIIVKLNSSGDILWCKTIGGTGSDLANLIIQSPDGGFMIAGQTSSYGVGDDDAYIIKIDVDGNLIWNKTYGGGDGDRAASVINTSDNGFAIAGRTNSFGVGLNDFIIVKVDEAGSLQWCKTIGTSTFGDACFSIVQTVDGGYVLGGSTGQSQSQHYIVKFDVGGTLQWTNFVSTNSSFYTFTPLIQTADSGLVLAGFSNNIGAGGNDMFIMKFDFNGLLQWNKSIGGTGNERATSLIQAADGGFVAAGYTNSFGMGGNDMYIVKFDEQWNTCGNSLNHTSGTGNHGDVTSPTPIVTSPTPTILTHTPSVTSGGTLTEICILLDVKTGSNEIPERFSLNQNYPNPFNPSTLIRFSIIQKDIVSLKVYSVLGSEVATLINEHQNAGTYEVEWDAGSFPSGIYFYKLQTENFTATKKMVLTK